MYGSLSLVDGPVFVGAMTIAAVLVALLVSPVPGVLRSRRRHLVRVAILAAFGALVGVLVTWLLGDVFNVFGISLTWVIRWADAIAFAAVGVALANLIRTRWWRKIVAVLSVAATLVGLSLIINVDFGQYRTIADAIGSSYNDPAQLPPRAGAPVPLEDWKAPADLSEKGTVGYVTIPATKSGFPARTAYIYLPPAAFAPKPPALPVIVAFSGQPGDPADVFRAGKVEETLDAIAAKHDGVAPILVAADQLSSPTHNPMCVDGPLGNSETYLTVDVPAWITAHLPVTTERTGWTVAGFSQGGTCAIQLGAGHPELFGSLVDVSGEQVPSVGSVEHTIEAGFGGDAKAYQAATPAGLLAAHEPYPDTIAFFVAGENDAKYTADMKTVSALARQAGMRVSTELSPGTAHDWNTARYGFQQGFDSLVPFWGIR